MLQLNLLPDVKKEFLHAQRQRNLVMTVAIIASLAAGGVVLMLGLVMVGQVVQKNILTGNIDRDKQTIQTAQDEKQLDEYLTIQNQLSQIDSLKESQGLYSRLFDYLRQLNPADPNNVELSSVNVVSAAGGSSVSNSAQDDTSRVIELQGTTASFESLDVYKTTLMRATITYSKGQGGKSVTEPLFSAVVVKEADLSRGDESGDRAMFTINVTYNPAAFSVDSEDIELKVPHETTSDAERNAPNSIFNGQPAEDIDTRGQQNE